VENHYMPTLGLLAHDAWQQPLALCCAGLACAQALVVLNASKNQLGDLPGDMLAAWLCMRELDVSSNQLTVGRRS
jgi:hypothetical protein